MKLGHDRRPSMFDILDDKIKHDDAVEKTTKEQLLEGVAIAVLSVLFFVGLFMAVGMLT
jgi:hypothetical protein